MLTKRQQKFLLKIPKDKAANIQPWDPKAADFAKDIVEKIQNLLDLEVFWEGSLALEIPGENDIDLYIFASPKDFDKYLPGLISILDKPTYTLPEKILWRTKKSGYKIDATLTEKGSPEVIMDMLFYNSLKGNTELLNEYNALKTLGLSEREYYLRKNEFYNRITGNK